MLTDMATPLVPSAAPSSAPVVLLAGVARSSRRSRRPRPGAEVHAVPHGDRTRSALCGASVAVDGSQSFPSAPSSTCPDCVRVTGLGETLARAS